MRDTTVARSYAAALFELAERRNLHDDILASLDVLEAALAAEPRLFTFLTSPTIEAAAKKSALLTALQGRVDPYLLNFLMVLIDKRRQRLLADIGQQYRQLLDERRGRVHVQITLARPADEAMRTELSRQLGRALNREVVPEVHVNQDILGGVIVRYGDRVLDGSLRRRLLSLRRRLLDVGLPTTS